MFTVSVSNDITQLMVKRQLRNNQSVLFLIKSTDKLEETSDILRAYSDKATEVFYNRVIEKPDYDEVVLLNSVIGFTKTLNLNEIPNDVSVVFGHLGAGDRQLLTESIYQVFKECLDNKLPKSMITNGYIRCLNTLNKRLSKITYNLTGDNRLLFVGKPDKYDILAFTVLGLCGSDVVLCDLDEGMTSECMCVNRFVLIQGQYRNINLDFLKFINKGISNIENGVVLPNEWVNFNDYKNLEDSLKLIGFEINNRFEKNKWKVLHIDLQGVNSSNYVNILENFMLNLKASHRPFTLMDSDITNSTYDEVEDYRKRKEKDIFAIFQNYPIFKNSGVVVKVGNQLDKIINQHNFQDTKKIEKYKDTMKIWLIRYLDMFFKGTSLNELPLIVAFNITSEKDKELISLLSCLPLDILIFSPEYRISYHTDSFIGSMKCILLGESSKNIQKYPENVGVNKVATTAYNAEQELNTVLYSDTSLFRIKQFKNINPIVLKTTYEEVGIYWNEPAKFRPSFESVGDLVTVPNIFVKVNGVNETYLSDIKKMLNRNTVLYQSYPIQLQPSIMGRMGTLRDFSKQLVFKDYVDFERLVKSEYYTYGVYSQETQQLIVDKAKKLIELNWCNMPPKNLVYDIIDTVFRLPQNILQMIHNYDFTGDIPKIIIFNGSSQPCTLSDCILLMFLKLIGFDIVVFAPTGYRVIEQYISNQWFNENTIGQYDFNMNTVNFNFIQASEKKKTGFFGKLFV